MKIDKFFEEFIKENYPNAGRIRRWWERARMNIWLKLPSGKGKETNGDFVKDIPDYNL